MPARDTFDTWFDAIIERRYYTNHGPLVSRLDRAIAERLDVKHAVSVTNGTVALMVALVALELSGDVIVPAFTFPATVQALHWAGLTPVFADVDSRTHMLTAESVAKVKTDRTSAVLGVHVWGRACAPAELEAYCRQNDLRLLYDACHAFGCSFDGKMIGNFGDAEVFSFHATKIVNAAEGGCITTNDDDLAARLITARNFHRSPKDQSVYVRLNGKMSEAQAAMALMALSQFEEFVDRNEAIYSTYERGLEGTSGIKAIRYDRRNRNNFQYAVFEIEPESSLSRDQILDVLRAENIYARRYFFPSVHRLSPYCDALDGEKRELPVTTSLCQTVLQLPLGAQINPEDAELIAALLDLILENGDEIKARAEATAGANSLRSGW
ncbi:hypothetical protein CH339_05015 [Rhodobium orientis]|uniref:dTDP-4-dehydro-6-deoxyglucose aminotransferase n=2 Tax=Rhodobium orientis TaxID=34017 RepID=A0A327JTB1_9HYPH|nr:DegT/DnrJ/EryC1/StrS family aminotransferase [Rhodobium orientis]MBK5948246.1 hypothetical protein [Rhodobium orientis]RAI28855.1 hypothetical protein CH339_05015 [Rhodobium orientis]